MADAIIDLVGPDELPVIVSIFNQIIRPPRDVESFRRRFLGRYNILSLVARIQDRPVGFFLGFELKPTVYFAWFYGVLPEFRRQGIASQLMEAVHSWARLNDYESIRFECHNQHRPMLHPRPPRNTTSSESAGTRTVEPIWSCSKNRWVPERG